MLDGFDFATQTSPCKYCHKPVSVRSTNWHLQYCEEEKGRAAYIDLDHPAYTHAPLSSALGNLDWAIGQYGPDAPLGKLIDGRMGSFAEARTEQTITDAIRDMQGKMSLGVVRDLIAQANCPLCHQNPCICGR